MFPRRWCSGGEGLLFFCMSLAMVTGLNTTGSLTSESTPISTTTASAHALMGIRTASATSVSMETESTTPSDTSTPSVTMTTTLGSTTAVTPEPPVHTTSAPTTSAPTTSAPTPTTPVSTTNTPTTPAPIIPDAEHFKAVTQTESSITLEWSQPANYSHSSFNYTLQFEEGIIDISGGRAGTMKYTVEELSSATWYNFTLYTREEMSNSSGVSVKALTAPINIGSVRVVDQNSSSILLQWDAMNVTAYLVEYRESQGNVTREEKVPVEPGVVNYNYTASNLSSASSYNFTIYSQLENISSSGLSIDTVTAPRAVTMVSVKRSLREVELSWSRDNNANFHLLFGDWTISPLPIQPWSDQVQYMVSSLQEGTVYNYSIIPFFQGVNGSTYQDYTVTKRNCTAVGWQVTNSTIQASDLGVFTNVHATNVSTSQNETVPDGTGNLTITGLYPGATYELSVYYRTFLQCQHTLTLSPSDISARCEYESMDAISLHWAQPAGVWTGVEVNMTGRTPHVVWDGGKLHTVLRGFQPAQTYKVSVCLLSGPLRSAVYILDCSTDPAVVIAGSFVSVLLFLLLVAMAVYYWRRRSNTQRNRHGGGFVAQAKSPENYYKPIAADMFEEHVRQMSWDDNRGFSEEYESFLPIGKEQTCHAANNQENQTKNRFTNVLPYDWSRVKLSMMTEQKNSDYINASYLPGYRGSKEYIAAQGPLAETIDDFWRMVWEQGVRAIAMVTNCIEGERVKCEQYWPLDYTPCLYGDFLVTTTSEQTQPSWTIRTFTVKNRVTKEQRTVEHFHFRAWPDHGVPEGTGPLLQFRALLRRYIEQEGGGAPTMVHCSAGVGRTGTLVALDVLLQQLETKGMVNVAAYVQKMRRSRTLMVQMESQYVFLHHCILDAMQKSEPQEEPQEEHTYQNWGAIYANATALQELSTSD